MAFHLTSPTRSLTLLPNFHLILKVEVNGNKQDASNWNCSNYLSFWLVVLQMQYHVQRRERTARTGRGFHVSNFTVVSLLNFCFLFFFHGYLSHPLRLGARWGAFWTKVPFSLLGQVLPGNKTKTTGFHSMKQFSLPLLRDLPLQSIEFQNRLAERQKLRPWCNVFILGNEI